MIQKQKLLATVLFCAGFCVQSQAQVGIGTNQPLARLHVAEGPVLFSAEGNIPSNPAPVPLTGSGRRMMWYPDKAAFRVGYVNGDEWDTESIGAASFASGEQTRANGPFSTALGRATEASGEMSTAMGFETKASGYFSTAMGIQTIASGAYSTATGSETLASGDYSTAMGVKTRALGSFSTAMGFGTIAGDEISLAVGTFNAMEPGDIFVVGNGASDNQRSNALSVTQNGTLTVRRVLQSSDARLKSHILPLPEALSKLLELNGYQYNWNTAYADSNELHTGLLAQEVQKLMPELVKEDAAGTLSVNYSGLIPYLIEGMKEQQKIINELRADRKEVEALIASQKEMRELLVSQQELIKKLSKPVGEKEMLEITN